MTLTLGIDISHHNGTWSPEHLPPDVRFVLAKATEGVTFADPAYMRYRDQQLRTATRWGAYHVYRADMPPTLQARHFRSHARLQPGHIAALDVEHQHAVALVKGLRTEGARRVLQTWLGDVAVHERCTPLLYVSTRGLKVLTNNWREPLDGLAGYPLWLAQYVTLHRWRPRRVAQGPVLPRTHQTWALWQYTSSGRGKDYGFASTRMDLDMINGGIERWDEWAVRNPAVRIEALP